MATNPAMLDSLRINSMDHLAQRGYHASYKENEINHCPGCGRTHWIIGRITAECAFCTTSLQIDLGSKRGTPNIIHHKNMKREAESR